MTRRSWHGIDDQSIAEDNLWVFQVPASALTDVDNASLTFSATLASGAALPGWLSFDAATRTFVGTPPLNYTGSLNLKVTASDGSFSASDTFTLTVTPINDASVVALPITDQNVAEGVAWSFAGPGRRLFRHRSRRPDLHGSHVRCDPRFPRGLRSMPRRARSRARRL